MKVNISLWHPLTSPASFVTRSLRYLVIFMLSYFKYAYDPRNLNQFHMKLLFDLIKFSCSTWFRWGLCSLSNFTILPRPSSARTGITHKKCDPFQIFHWGWICNERKRKTSSAIFTFFLIENGKSRFLKIIEFSFSSSPAASHHQRSQSSTTFKWFVQLRSKEYQIH